MKMRILALADEESKYLWEYFEESKLDDIDLIISCGDLAPQYLEFLATYAKVPVLYIHGNHDACYMQTPPRGCLCIEDDIYVYKGYRIMGLGGCMKYNFSPFQYTEEEMRKRYKRMWFKLFRQKGIDILVTHAAAKDLNDAEDRPHKGFQCFIDILDKYKPKLFLHGHVHKTYSRDFKRESTYNDTIVLNVYERYVIEI